jgi:hypothetical protein
MEFNQFAFNRKYVKKMQETRWSLLKVRVAFDIFVIVNSAWFNRDVQKYEELRK